MRLTRLKQSIRRLIRPLALQALAHRGTIDATFYRLRQLRNKGVEIRLAVDGGASTGQWAKGFRKVYPKSQILCVEPRESAQGELRRFAEREQGIHIAQTLIGSKEGTATFNEHGDQSSIYPNVRGNQFGQTAKLKITTLDSLFKVLSLPLPDLIKLDLQGAELSCLDGAAQCLEHVKVIILEVSIQTLYAETPLFADVVRYMDSHGFRCYDILSLYQRPIDGALAFCDMLFARQDQPLFQKQGWANNTRWEQ